jgi:hypothetical protein
VSYYEVTSASIGLTLGVAQHSELIVFMTGEALGKFTASQRWSIGADTAVALVSNGAGGAECLIPDMFACVRRRTDANQVIMMSSRLAIYGKYTCIDIRAPAARRG